MKKFLLFLLVLSVGVAWAGAAWAHCEVPCGIYGDDNRLADLREDMATIEKAMGQIEALAKQTPVNYNQIVRWVNTKEAHATKIQQVVMQYFLTQRIKPVDDKAGPARQTYLHQIELLHRLLVNAMKAKQGLDKEAVHQMRHTLDAFAKSYGQGKK